MRIGSIATLGVTGILMMSACSSASNEQTGKSGNTTGNGNANTVVVANSGEVTPVSGADTNVANFTSGDRTVRQPNSIRGEGMTKSGESITTGQALEIARKNAQPAPENSTFYSYLGDAAYEVRTFNKHPQLLKVEKKTLGDGKSTMKVFLRGGKVVEMDGNRLLQLSSAPAQIILELAGVQRNDPVAPAGQPREKKPSE